MQKGASNVTLHIEAAKSRVPSLAVEHEISTAREINHYRLLGGYASMTFLGVAGLLFFAVVLSRNRCVLVFSLIFGPYRGWRGECGWTQQSPGVVQFQLVRVWCSSHFF